MSAPVFEVSLDDFDEQDIVDYVLDKNLLCLKNGDFDSLLVLMKNLGIPEDLQQPILSYLREPIADSEALERWTRMVA